VVIFIDKDAESASDLQALAKSLSAVGRGVVLVRVIERSRDDMRDARGVYLMPSEISEPELLALGAHLREFAERHSLAQMPGDAEWRAYHQGLNQIARYSPTIAASDLEEIPHLFLIGIYPFVSERITDVNSLEQYYFQKWDRLESANVKSIIHTIAAAGVFNLSIPYNALRRHAQLDLSELESPGSNVHRTIETFIEWRNQGTNLEGRYLRIRHPIIGGLLCRAIDPVEGAVPFRPILGILSRLTTKADDLWFAETLVFRIGQNFRANSSAFSLESDTPMQKAARASFDAIPRSLKEISRPIAHHEARYHIHIIHACIDGLERPQSTTLTPEQIWRSMPVPVRDVGAFAYAVCERSSGGVIVQTTLSQLSGPLPADKPCVLDGEGRRLSEVAAIIGERSGTDSLAVIYNFIEDRTQDLTLEYDPEPNMDVFYPAIQMLFDKCAKTPDSLAFLRFCTRGFSIFEDDYELFDRPQELNLIDRDWTERFCHRLAHAWRFSDRPIYAQHILQWLQQFERSGFGVEARQLLVYLYRYGYVTERKIAAGLVDGFRALSAQLGSAPIGVAFQAPGKSESRIAYKLRPGIWIV
jgi:hypothetical protein